MAYLDDADLPADTPTLISQSGTAITAARIQNAGNFMMLVKPSATETPPADWGGAIRLKPGVALEKGKTMSDLFSIPSGYYYGLSISQAGKASVSHD